MNATELVAAADAALEQEIEIHLADERAYMKSVAEAKGIAQELIRLVIDWKRTHSESVLPSTQPNVRIFTLTELNDQDPPVCVIELSWTVCEGTFFTLSVHGQDVDVLVKRRTAQLSNSVRAVKVASKSFRTSDHTIALFIENELES